MTVCIISVMEVPSSFTTQGPIWSGPAALCTFSCSSSFCTPGSVMSMSLGVLTVQGVDVVWWGNSLVNTDSNSWFMLLAFSLGLCGFGLGVWVVLCLCSLSFDVLWRPRTSSYRGTFPLHFPLVWLWIQCGPQMFFLFSSRSFDFF